MSKLKQLNVENYQFGKYDKDPTVQKKKKKQRKKEDLLIALAISKALSKGQSRSNF